MIYNIDPAPHYPEEALEPPDSVKQLRRAVKLAQERNRDNSMIRSRLKERFNTGRLYSHVRLQEMKEYVASINKKESGIEDDDKPINLQNLKLTKGIVFD